jgi:hypothetical protein
MKESEELSVMQMQKLIEQTNDYNNILNKYTDFISEYNNQNLDIYYDDINNEIAMFNERLERIWFYSF